MSDEDNWQVPVARRAPLLSHRTRVCNGGRDDAILYYPGSGADVLHALFAAGAKARYFIFVDTMGLEQSLSQHIRVHHSRLHALEARRILCNIGIRSNPAIGWMFCMQGVTRFLFHFRMSHNTFAAENRGFGCDMVFEKDFWETEDDVDLGDVLAMLRVGGHYSTNASLGMLIPALSLVGLDYVDTYNINGDQFLFQRRTATLLTWSNLKAALAESQKVVYALISDDDKKAPLSYCRESFDQNDIRTALINSEAAMRKPFEDRGINMPVPTQKRLWRQIAVKAVGAASQNYIGGIELAFG